MQVTDSAYMRGHGGKVYKLFSLIPESLFLNDHFLVPLCVMEEVGRHHTRVDLSLIHI